MKQRRSLSIYKSLITLSAFCKPLDLEFLCSLEESRKLLLCHVHLPSIHELQDGCEVGKGDVLQDDNGMLGGVLLQKVLEVWRACTEDHLVCLGMLTLVKQKHQHKKNMVSNTSVAMVTSQKLFSSLRCLKDATMLAWKSFHRRQNCWSSAIVVYLVLYDLK